VAKKLWKTFPSYAMKVSGFGLFGFSKLAGDVIYFLLDAPDKETILQFHLRSGFDCDWIEDVTSIKSYEDGNAIALWNRE